MNRAARRLARHQWREVANGIIRDIDPRIDVDRFVEKHQDSLSAELRRASVTAEGMRSVARDMVEKYVVAELAVCPIRARDLMEKGVTGERLGVMLQEADRVWRERGVDREGLWKHLADQYGDLGEV